MKLIDKTSKASFCSNLYGLVVICQRHCVICSELGRPAERMTDRLEADMARVVEREAFSG